MAAYYNEIDAYAAEWLRNLIKAGHIADGEVDTRSIVDVQPDELREFTQCHFFAGIAGWSHALRLAGWEDERQIWTGSCPCQPFSVAGQGKGVNDERHLWPHFFRLIRGCRPPVVMGEQVAGAAGYGWLDGVRSDLEGESYSCEGVDIPACSANAPHIRSRLYWVAMDNTQSERLERWRNSSTITATESNGSNFRATGSNPHDMAVTNIDGHDGARGHAAVQGGYRKNDGIFVGSGSDICSDMANADSGRCVEAGERGTLDTIHPRELHDRMSIAERDPCGIDVADTKDTGRQSIAIQRSSSELIEGDISSQQRQQFSSNNASTLRRESFARAADNNMANAKRQSEGRRGILRSSEGVEQMGSGAPAQSFGSCADNINMADANGEQLRGGHAGELISPSSSNEGEAWERQRVWSDTRADGDIVASDMADSASEGLEGSARASSQRWGNGSSSNSHWDNAIWLNGADGKTRRAQPDICLLAHGVPARVGKLRAYGNAIVPPLAAQVIKAFMETL